MNVVKQLLTISLLCVFLPCNTAEKPYQITDSFGKHWFDRPPERVVVTDWTLLENLLELGVVPVGAPEIDHYRRFATQPAVPESVMDVGKRISPALATIRQLQPDVVILGTKQKDLARAFSSFANVNYYNSFSERYRTNGKKSRQRFLQIAQMFQKTSLANQKLAYLDQRILELRNELQLYFVNDLPRVTTCRFGANESILIYGYNSMPHYALQLLGIDGEYEVEASTWGEESIRLNELASISEGYLVCFKPNDNQDIFQHPDWQALPAVINNQFYLTDPVWSYGGAMSVLYIAEAIAKTLMAQ